MRRAGALVAAFVGRLALLLSAAAVSPALAQEYEDYATFVPDSAFEAAPRSPVSYYSVYQRDQARNNWTQNVGYSRTVRRFALGFSGGTSTSEDLLGLGSKNTSGDFTGRLDWRATSRWILSLDGNYAMNSIADRTSQSEQRRNRLALKSQYSFQPLEGARLTLLGSSEFQRNHDLRVTERFIVASESSAPDSLFARRDSSFFHGRLDALRGQLDWTATGTLTFRGIASGSRIRPTTNVRFSQTYWPQDASSPKDSTTVQSVRQPADNSLLDGTVTFTGVRATKVVLQSKRSGIDRVYFDLGQLQVEQSSYDARTHTVNVQSGVLAPAMFGVTATLNRSLRLYQARPNLNALITTREVTATAGYSTRETTVGTSFSVNRTRAERQAASNGLTISRLVSANVTQRVRGHLWLVGLGSASLFSYQYLVPDTLDQPFSVDDRDVANAFGSIGMRFGITPRCSTAANFSVNRSHNVSIDAVGSSGNIATTIYQINGSIRLPLGRGISIGQDYVLSTTYRLFDYAEERNDLTRNFRLETSVVDSLTRFAYLRLDHRYYFFDRGDFTPIAPGGPRLYGVSQEQFQQILQGTVGVRPIPGVTFVATQSLADTRTHQIFNDVTTTTQQWNLSLGLEVNRTFWDGAGLIGAVRHESRYQNLGSRIANEEDNWIAGVTFQKDF